MSTLRRIQVNFEPNIAKFLAAKAKEKNISISKLTNEFVKEMMELEEDFYLSKLALQAEKESENKPTTSLEELCKELNLE